MDNALNQLETTVIRLEMLIDTLELMQETFSDEAAALSRMDTGTESPIVNRLLMYDNAMAIIFGNLRELQRETGAKFNELWEAQKRS
jgi:hypothetical protein